MLLLQGKDWIDFSSLCFQVSALVPDNMKTDLTAPICFVFLLHLANEKVSLDNRETQKVYHTHFICKLDMSAQGTSYLHMWVVHLRNKFTLRLSSRHTHICLTDTFELSNYTPVFALSDCCTQVAPDRYRSDGFICYGCRSARVYIQFTLHQFFPTLSKHFYQESLCVYAIWLLTLYCMQKLYSPFCRS